MVDVHVASLRRKLPDVIETIDARADVVTELGPTDLEPPTLSLGKDVVRFGPLAERYTERGDEYLLFAQRIPGDARQAIVAASWLGPYEDDANDLRRDVTLISIAVVPTGKARASGWRSWRRSWPPTEDERARRTVLTAVPW